MKILALDLATKTGWAHSDGSSGVWKMPNHIKGDHNGWRFNSLAAWLADTLQEHPADIVVYEQAHHRGGATTRLAVGMVGVVELVAAREGIERVRGYHSATIKKHATGRGNSQKPDMLAAAQARNPEREYIDDNEVDALFLLDLAQSEL